ncbi:TonB-dependent siderophore receptor [Mangrovicella endophytica]|uniref:TonB-dependent siderophore receptor n=1 Tax=Mangrovicella endophytica TaxID=2066697 RepID=UPI0012FFFAAB|nr:TonB-dependent siderophore receptor [Mangrovicella endophytica]
MSSRLSRRTRHLLLSCSLLLPAQAYAQDIVLDTVVVEGNGSGDATSGTGNSATGPVEGYTAETTTTGSKTATPLIEIPQSISVVTTDQLEDRGVQNLGEALNYTAGVISQPFGNDVRYFAPIIRGFDATNSVYLNNFRFIRDFGALAFEPFGQERIEVIKGPASVLYGQGEPGGLINLIQKRPTGETFGEAGIEVGSDNRYVAKFDYAGVANDVVSYRLTGLGRLADGEQDFIEDNRFYIAPTVTIEPDADTSFTLLSSLQYDTGTSQIGLPLQGTINDNPNGSLPPSRYLGEPDFNDNESWIGTIGYEFRHRFNETFEVRQNVQYLKFDADSNNLYFSFLDPVDLRTGYRGVNVQSETIDSLGIDNQLEAKFDTGAMQHTTLVGLDYKLNNQWRSSNFSGSVGPIDVFDPVYGQPVTVNPDGANITDVTQDQVGLYLQDQIKFDRLNVSLGLRQDWAGLDDNESGDEANYDKLTGRAGALYLFDNGFAPFVGYSTSFSPTAGVSDVTGELFDPTEGEQIEGGFKYQPLGWNSFITASVYDLTKTNVVSTQAVPDGAGGLESETSQTGEIRSRGFEFEATANLSQGLSLIAAYTYTDAEITEGDDTIDATTGLVTATTTGNRPANIPEHAASLWLNYELQSEMLKGLSFGGGMRYIGERYGNNANTIDLSSATVFDAAIRYERDSFEAKLNVNNIADKEYFASCNFGCFYGEGRQVIGSLTYKW